MIARDELRHALIDLYAAASRAVMQHLEEAAVPPTVEAQGTTTPDGSVCSGAAQTAFRRRRPLVAPGHAAGLP